MTIDTSFAGSFRVVTISATSPAMAAKAATP